MSQNKKQTSILFQKLLFTVIIVLFYILGKSIPLFGVDVSEKTLSDMNLQTLLLQSISGDRYQMSLLTLGIFPYMIASLVIQIFMSLMSSDRKSRISPKKINLVTLIMMLIIAVIQSIYKIGDLTFRYEGMMLSASKIIVFFEMIAGVFVILWLSTRNAKYGIGGQTILIFVNILDGLASTVQGNGINNLIIPFLISLIVMVVVIFMENGEIRIPVQRIGIHSIFADKNYLAIKMNPIGIMPVMFSSAVFMFVQMIVAFFYYVMPNNSYVQWIQSNMNVTRPLGIVVYILILYLLTIVMSFVFLSPKETTEQLLKSGDSIVNLHSGKPTKRFLVKQLLKACFLSATIMGICILLPIVLQYFDIISGELAMIPTSIMMATGMFINLYQEVIAVKNYDAYKPFI